MTEKVETVNRSWTKYRLFLAGVFALQILFLWKTILNATYSLYVLVSIVSVYGFGILNDAARNDLIAGFAWEFASFSWISIVSVGIVIAAWVVLWKAMVYFVAQFILPVSDIANRKKAGERFSLFIKGGHGAAVFVKEGSLIERKNETEGKKETFKPGVALVDLSSAVILSQEEDTQAWNLSDTQDEDFEGLTKRMVIPKKKKEQVPFVETRGPGLVFTEKGQKIFSAVDLRPQTRFEIVEAYTRDGIKLSTKVTVGFSLSDKAEVIPVGMIGDELRWLEIEKSSDSRTMTVRRSFNLDIQDRHEILDYVNNVSEGHFVPEEPVGTSVITPYKFYPNRVFHAAYSKARGSKTGDFVPWYDAPLEIAVDLFRNELSAIPFDDLYTGLDFQQRDNATATLQPKQSVQTLKKLKDDFGRRVKLKGLVHFQYYGRRGNLSFREGEAIDMKQVSNHPVIALSQSKFNSLRSVGVVVKSAGFGDLKPMNSEIKKKMIENWKARWEKEVHFINAEYELEAVRVRNRNRAQIQQEMTYLLAGIFKNSHTDEALALRVFQALESAATNPMENSDISPKEIVSMLDSLHKWLLIDRRDVLDLSPQGDGKNEK